jgi:hypothetical protein
MHGCDRVAGSQADSQRVLSPAAADNQHGHPCHDPARVGWTIMDSEPLAQTQ